ncbi:MAG: hypothetical protein H7333_01040 [Bdellovibrionales bacterium]|nr:hypothetical protein [Oligoflexia bacterium]
MKKITITAAVLCSAGFLVLCPASAYAKNSSFLKRSEMSSERMARAEKFIQGEVRSDLLQNLDARIEEVGQKGIHSKQELLTRENQAVLLKGAYLALQGVAPFMLDEADFNRGMEKVLNFLADHHSAPAGVTIGAIHRVSAGEVYTVGGNVGIEATFYLKRGKLMMTRYTLLGGHVGVSIPGLLVTSMTEYYAALCFGNCTPTDNDGWYVGIDGDAAVGLGGGFFLEIGLELNEMFEAYGKRKPYTLKELYEASCVRVGFGVEVGEAGSLAASLYYFSKTGKDAVLARSNDLILPEMVAKQGPGLKF